MGRPRPHIETAPLAAAASSTPRQSEVFQVAGIEVTQVIQNMAHEVALLTGKTTVVRVYLARYNPVEFAVRGDIELTGPTGVQAASSQDVLQLQAGDQDDLTSCRLHLSRSLNFVLPPLAQSGRYSVRLTRVYDVSSGALLSEAAPGHSPLTFDLQPGAPLRVRLVFIQHHVAGGRVVEPNVRDRALVLSWLRRAYPVAEVLSSQITTPAPRPWPFDATLINAQLTAMRNLDLESGGDPRVHYLAIVADDGGPTFVRGAASSIPSVADPSAVATSPAGSGLWAWDSDGSYGDWYAGHELAHTFGRTHLGSGCGDRPADPGYPFPGGALCAPDEAFVGFDPGDSALGLPMRVYRGTTSHDVMSYCDFIWISAFTYAEIRQRIADEAALSAPRPRASAFRLSLGRLMKPRRVWLNIVGTVDLTGRTGSIDYVQPLEAEAAPSPVASERVTLQLYDAQGELLGSSAARVKWNACRDEDEHETGVLDTFVIRPPRLTRIELRIDGDPVATFRSGGRPRGDTALASSSAADPIRYNVQISIDKGSHWQTVAVGLSNADAYQINRADFAGVRQLRRRVLATDGLRTWPLREDDIPMDEEGPA